MGSKPPLFPALSYRFIYGWRLSLGAKNPSNVRQRDGLSHDKRGRGAMPLILFSAMEEFLIALDITGLLATLDKLTIDPALESLLSAPT